MAARLNREGYEQWNVRLPPDLCHALRAHLSDPLLVTLPKGRVAEFFTTALTAELKRVNAWPPSDATASSARPSPTPLSEAAPFF